MRIAFVSSEVAPFAKTGGLGDVVAALARWLHRRGHDVRVFLPRYGNLKPSGQTFVPVSFLQGVRTRMGWRDLEWSVSTATLPGSDLSVYFVANATLYGRAATYTADADEAARFAFLSRAALECCQRMGWAPDVVHAHDWHAGLVPLLLRTVYGWDRIFADTRTLLTIHNVGYAGTFPSGVIEDLGLGELRPRFHQEHLRAGRVSFLATGILYADALTTVSETHAREIQTPEQGFGMDALLRARRGSLFGVLNGIDTNEWDPSRDPRIPARYSSADLSGKWRCKESLLAELGLPFAPSAPVLAVISRLVGQKGFELCGPVLPEVLATRDARLVVLGTGERRYEDLFAGLARAFPRQARYVARYDDALAHRIEAGSDVFLMPSLYEPCGLNQMYSQRYGTVPVVRRTGGLADTVSPWDPATGQGTGFLFDHYTPEGLRWALGQALDTWRDPVRWTRLVRNGMAQDFSWDRRVLEYEALYRRR